MYIPGLVCLVLAATVKVFRKKQRNDWQACPRMIKPIDSVRKKHLDGVSYEHHFKTPASGQSVGLQKGQNQSAGPLQGCLFDSVMGDLAWLVPLLPLLRL